MGARRLASARGRPVTALAVVDRFAEGLGSVDGRLLGRVKLFEADDENTTRSAAGEPAGSGVHAGEPAPQRGVTWRAESESEIVASWEVPPERPSCTWRSTTGAVRAYWAWRWGDMGQKAFGYMPCGCEVGAERRFGDLVVPSRSPALGGSAPRARRRSTELRSVS